LLSVGSYCLLGRIGSSGSLAIFISFRLEGDRHHLIKWCLSPRFSRQLSKNIREALPPLQGEGRGGDGDRRRTPIPLLSSPLKGEGRVANFYGDWKQHSAHHDPSYPAVLPDHNGLRQRLPVPSLFSISRIISPLHTIPVGLISGLVVAIV
jgi:hypothetical protein